MTCAHVFQHICDSWKVVIIAVGGSRSPFTKHSQDFIETEITCSWMEIELSRSPKFPKGVRGTNTTYSYSQSKNSTRHKNSVLHFLGAIFTSSWPPLPPACSRVYVYVLIICKGIMQLDPNPKNLL